MKIDCPDCGRNISISSSGKAERHYPSPKVTLTPKAVCSYSDTQLDESEYTRQCHRCGKVVLIDDDGDLSQHYPDPHSTLSAEDYCQDHQRNYGATHPQDSSAIHWEPGRHAEYNP